jgi:hypothetical protein
MKKKKVEMLRATDKTINDGLMERIRELGERVDDLVLNAQADAHTIAELRRKETAVPELQDRLSEVNAELAKRAEKAKIDAKRINELGREISFLRGQLGVEKIATMEATRLLEKEKAAREEGRKIGAEIRADLARAIRAKRDAEYKESELFDRCVDAETKLDAAKVEVENKKAWYDMKLVGEVALRKQLEERIEFLEKVAKEGDSKGRESAKWQL